MAVVQNDDKFDFECEICEWSSRQWPEETMALTRGDEHYNEHVTGEPMRELIEFEQSVGFVRPVVPGETITVQTSTGDTLTFTKDGQQVVDTEEV